MNIRTLSRFRFANYVSLMITQHTHFLATPTARKGGRSFKIARLLAMGAMALTLATACADGDRDTPDLQASAVPSSTSVPQRSAEATGTPPATAAATADASLDPIVQALLARDWPAIQPLLVQRPEPCVRPFTAASAAPPCPEGAAVGTPVNVFPAVGCHAFMSEAELPGKFEAGKASNRGTPTLFAIYRASTTHPRYARLPAGVLGIVLDRDGFGGQMFTVSNGKIVSADFGCATPPLEMLANVPSNMYLVAPPGR